MQPKWVFQGRSRDRADLSESFREGSSGTFVNKSEGLSKKKKSKKNKRNATFYVITNANLGNTVRSHTRIEFGKWDDVRDLRVGSAQNGLAVMVKQVNSERAAHMYLAVLLILGKIKHCAYPEPFQILTQNGIPHPPGIETFPLPEPPMPRWDQSEQVNVMGHFQPPPNGGYGQRIQAIQHAKSTDFP